MNAFEYANPTSLDDAVSLLSDAWGETEILAGGTDLISALKQELIQPKLVVSLKNVSELAGIGTKDGQIRIGAMTRLGDLIANADVAKNFPALTTAAQNVAAPQIINRGTVGGDLLQRPRCWYFRQGFGLLATHEGKSLVPDGDNRYHAILGNSGPAYFVNPSSLAPGLIALGATLTVQGPGGSREVAAAEFFSTPKKDDEREYTIKPNEVLVAITIPIKGLCNGTYEVRQRRGLDWPMVTASVAYTCTGSGEMTATDASVVLGHVAPEPWYSKGASKALEGLVIRTSSGMNEDGLAKVAKAAVKGAKPLSKNSFKVQQARTAVIRAITDACPA